MSRLRILNHKDVTYIRPLQTFPFSTLVRAKAILCNSAVVGGPAGSGINAEVLSLNTIKGKMNFCVIITYGTTELYRGL